MTKFSDMLNKNTQGIKKCEAKQKQQLSKYRDAQNVDISDLAKNYRNYLLF